MPDVLAFVKRHHKTFVAVIAAIMITGSMELSAGRSLLGPDGHFGWWEGNIWSSENSQRVADPYSFSHIVHGILFYAGLWLVARKLQPRLRLMIALAIESGWEMLENSPIIIERYRAATISLGYDGDSVLNSMSDILMMCLGFFLASRLQPRYAFIAVLAMELGCAFCIRDNLILNIIMLIHPNDAIRHWQMAIAPAV